MRTVGRVRFFSIDGGHWRSVVASDLGLAEAVLADQGVIALDDFLRSEWPDVSLEFFHWYENGPKRIRPFAVGHNKLYLCHSDWVPRYSVLLNGSRFLRYFERKRYQFLDNVIPIYAVFPQAEWRFWKRIAEYLKLYQPDLYVRLKSMLGR